MAQIPRADDNGLICPLHRKPMVDVCHLCPMWTMLRGTDNNTGEEVDSWNCGFAIMPKLMVENSNQQRKTGAAIESFRNVMVKQNDQVALFESGKQLVPERIT